MDVISCSPVSVFLSTVEQVIENAASLVGAFDVCSRHVVPLRGSRMEVR